MENIPAKLLILLLILALLCYSPSRDDKGSDYKQNTEVSQKEESFNFFLGVFVIVVVIVFILVVIDFFTPENNEIEAATFNIVNVCRT